MKFPDVGLQNSSSIHGWLPELLVGSSPLQNGWMDILKMKAPAPLKFLLFYSMSRFKRYFTGSFRVFLRICRCFNRKISLHPILALGGSTEEKVPGLKASTAAGLRQRHVRAFFLGHHKCTYLIIFIDIHSSCVIWCVYIIYLYYCITYVYIYNNNSNNNNNITNNNNNNNNNTYIYNIRYISTYI